MLVIDEDNYKNFTLDEKFEAINVVMEKFFIRVFKKEDESPFSEEDINEIKQSVLKIYYHNGETSAYYIDIDTNLFLCHKEGRYCRFMEKTPFFDYIDNNEDHFLIDEKYVFFENTYYYDIPLFLDSVKMTDYTINNISGQNLCNTRATFTFNFERKYDYRVLSEKMTVIKNGNIEMPQGNIELCLADPPSLMLNVYVCSSNNFNHVDEVFTNIGDIDIIECIMKTKKQLENIDDMNVPYHFEYYENYYYYYFHTTNMNVLKNYDGEKVKIYYPQNNNNDNIKIINSYFIFNLKHYNY